jgi:hypothetical protein
VSVETERAAANPPRKQAFERAPPSWGGSPREAFVGILSNAAKRMTSASEATSRDSLVRSRGFVVVCRNTTSLQAVQQWCIQQAQTDCLAVRYRIKKEPVFGTLLAALSDDSERLHAESGSAQGAGRRTRGTLLYSEDGEWPEVLTNGLFEDPTSTTRVGKELEKPTGTISRQWSATLLRFLGHQSVLAEGRRLVLLAEVDGEPNEAEWEAARASFFELLPERFGLVLAGAPEGFSLPDDPHYLELDLEGIEATPGDDAYVYKAAGLQPDRPAGADWLGFTLYADALARLLLHPATSPLAIAIHGPWGKGKSTFMELVQVSLLTSAQETGDKVVTVPFNAWQFEDSTQIWAGLASEVTSGLERELPWFRRRLMPLEYAWRDYKPQLIFELVLPAAAAALFLILAAVGIPYLHDWLDKALESSAAAKLLGAVLPWFGVLLASAWIIGSRAHRVLVPVSARVLTYIRRPDYRAQMGYQHRVMDDIEFVAERLRRHYPEVRVAVFIDDLDRCPDDKVMEMLQAIHLILGGSNFYVVFGIDTAMIYRAIEAHYNGDGVPLPPRFAETYLYKIVQLPFHLPQTRPEERAAFIAELFSKAAREAPPESDGADATATATEEDAPKGEGHEFKWDRNALDEPKIATAAPVEDTPAELRAFTDFQDYLEDNPREMKRLVNVHRLVKIMLQQEGRPPSKALQRKLVKWLVFCARWPDLVDDVLTQARDHPETTDSMTAALERVNADAAIFAALAGPEDTLTSADLAPDGTLAKAASISHLLVWEAAAEPEPEPAAV